MISIPFIICVIGLILWLIFSKTKLADPWVAEIGRLCFIIGLFWTVAPYAGKVAF
jgi:1,4-dihydroxy-2-naphthoate octaprenyltransferase